MKYVDEYRDAEVARGLARRVAETATRPWVLMEVCGGQTHSIVRYGIVGLFVLTWAGSVLIWKLRRIDERLGKAIAPSTPD